MIIAIIVIIIMLAIAVMVFACCKVSGEYSRAEEERNCNDCKSNKK